jgi:hypothetical protein
MEIGDGAAGDLTIVRPAGRAAHRAAEAKMRRAGFFGYHSPTDKEHHRASPKCRRESTPETYCQCCRFSDLLSMTPLLISAGAAAAS